MFKRILIALDISERSQPIFEIAIGLAKLTDARLMISNVLPCAQDDAALRQQADQETHPLIYDEEISPHQHHVAASKMLEVLRSLQTRATSAGIGADLAQPSGDPGQVICDLACSWGADLIIVGQRSITRFNESMLGSVSHYVTHHAPCPVLTVPHDGRACPEPSYGQQVAVHR